MTRVTTFQVSGHESTVIEVLTSLGFAFDPSRVTATTVLDTFDGRLHHAGLRLTSNESDRVELELSGNGIAPAHLVVDAPPRVPAGLPSGRFRTRIAARIGVRVLLSQLEFRARRTRGYLRDRAGKIVVVAELHDGVHVLDPPATGCPTATIEIHEVPGQVKQALPTLAVLRAVGIAECQADTVALCATAAGVDLAGFTATATVPLDSAVAAIDGFRLVLANLAATITANWQGTIDQTDPEFLHDLRIAVRRTRTVLGDARQVLPEVVREPTRREFAWLADLTSTPRDLDVYLLEWSAYTDPLGAEAAALLEPLRDLIERRRADAHIELERGLRSERATGLMASWQSWLAGSLASDVLPPRAGRPLGRHVAKRAARARDALLERGRLIAPDTPAEQLHDLRKDAKRLRYLLECFGCLLPDNATRQYLKRLKALQDNLGQHQDAEVHIDLLRAVARELHESGASAGTLVAIGQLTERLDQQRLTARAEFAECFAEYDTRRSQRTLDTVLAGISE